MPKIEKFYLSKRTVHIIGVISVIIALVYFNCMSSLKEGATNNDPKMQMYNHEETLQKMKGNICTNEQYNTLVKKVDELDKKSKQIQGLNNTTINSNKQVDNVSSS
jgi:hypothetical protein|uniref:Uncharacterized protein n=1 Tax=viral metagenome TaxID=1070528 RepID=A0A6C0IJC7_9ZZZZ